MESNSTRYLPPPSTSSFLRAAEINLVGLVDARVGGCQQDSQALKRFVVQSRLPVLQSQFGVFEVSQIVGGYRVKGSSEAAGQYSLSYVAV